MSYKKNGMLAKIGDKQFMNSIIPILYLIRT